MIGISSIHCLPLKFVDCYVLLICLIDSAQRGNDFVLHQYNLAEGGQNVRELSFDFRCRTP